MILVYVSCNFFMNLIILRLIFNYIETHIRELNALFTCKKFMQIDDLLLEYTNNGKNIKRFLHKDLDNIRVGVSTDDIIYTFYTQIEHIRRMNKDDEEMLQIADELVIHFDKWASPFRR